jgi:hypothetical protein
VADGLNLLAAGAALVPCLQGRGVPALWLALALVPPVVLLGVSGTYRQLARDRLRRLAGAVRAYPERDGPEVWAATALFVVIPAAFFFLSNAKKVGWGDSWPVVPTACSLVRAGDADLDEYLDGSVDWARPRPGALPYFAAGRDGRAYSSYPAGMVPFALPVVAAARLAGADLDSPRVRERLEKWTAAWVAAASLGLFFLTALHLAGPPAAFACTLLLATGSALFSTAAQALWQQGGVIFWSLVVLLAEFRQARRPLPGVSAVQGLACALMLACRPSAALFVVPFGLWLLGRAPRRAFAVALVAGLAFLPWVLLHRTVYGNCLGPSAAQLSRADWAPPRPEPLAGVLVSPGRGLLVYQPWLALAGLGLVPRLRRTPGEPAGWAGFAGVVIALHVLLVASWRCWWGGHCWGSRLLAEAVPLAALLGVRPAAALGRSWPGRGLLLGLFLGGLALHLPGAFGGAVNWNNRPDVDRHPERLWSWPGAPFLAPWHHRPAPTAGPAFRYENLLF